jgi:hypothetical protein
MIYKPKIQIWIYFGKPRTGKFCHNLWPLTYLEYLTATLHTRWPSVYFWSFGIFSPVLVCFTKKKSGNPGLRDY